MPLYEFDCEDCGQMVEILVRSQDPPACPECGGVKLDRRLSVPATPVTARGAGLPIASAGCDPATPPCSPVCCKLPR